MNRNPGSNGNSGIRRSVDGFVSIPSGNVKAKVATNSNPYSRSTPQYSTSQQPASQSNQSYQVPTKPVYHQYNNQYRKNSSPTSPQPQVTSKQQNNNQFSSINSYQPTRPTQSQTYYNSLQGKNLQQSESESLTPEVASALNSSIFPQHAKFYTNGYHVDGFLGEALSQVNNQPNPGISQDFVTQSNQDYPNHNHAYIRENNREGSQSQVRQSVIGSGSSISGTILSSSSSTSVPNQNITSQQPQNYSESYNNNVISSIQDINEPQSNYQNSKFFPTIGAKVKIRPIPNTIKYNSWFSLEWIVDVFKSFFGNSYKD